MHWDMYGHTHTHTRVRRRRYINTLRHKERNVHTHWDICTHIYTWIETWIRTETYWKIHTQREIHTHTHTHTQMELYTHTEIEIHTDAYIHTHTHGWRYTNTLRHMGRYTHTHTHMIGEDVNKEKGWKNFNSTFLTFLTSSMHQRYRSYFPCFRESSNVCVTIAQEKRHSHVKIFIWRMH